MRKKDLKTMLDLNVEIKAKLVKEMEGFREEIKYLKKQVEAKDKEIEGLNRVIEDQKLQVNIIKNEGSSKIRDEQKKKNNWLNGYYGEVEGKVIN